MEKKFGLIGFPVAHSFSKVYFEKKFIRESLSNHHYDCYSLKNINDLLPLLKENPTLLGLNVTIPHKEAVIGLLSSVDSLAKQIGAVNVIKINGSKLVGYNTDSIAFRETLKNWFPNPKGSMALILGTGGSSKAVQYALQTLSIPFLKVSRVASKGNITYENINEDHNIISSHNLIINTTPLGMSPNEQLIPDINCDLMSSTHFVYDLIYNPEKTQLLKEVEMRGATIKNGLEMLHLQAEKSWEIWNS